MVFQFLKKTIRGLKVAKFHFVEDYEKHVARLIKSYPIDTAMSLAVGGDFDAIGAIERDIIFYAGLHDDMSLIDLGCGSGRLASALSASKVKINYLGTDIVQKLLDYAAKKSDRNYKFKLHRELSIPAPSSSVDIVCAFSVFTHLLHHETYIYMQDIYRVLNTGGKLVFSFLEVAEPAHWPIFERTANNQRNKTTPHLNSFIERPAIAVWADKLGFSLLEFIDGRAAVPGSEALGQAVAILQRN